METMETTTQVNAIAMLRDFVAKRPGFELCNYGSMKYYRRDYNECLKDRNSFYELLNLAMDRYEARLNEVLTNYLSNSSDRLALENGKLRYHTGQYFPTEYRNAACRVLASLIWNSYRDEKREDGTKVYETGHEIRKAIKSNWRIRTRNTKLYFS